MSGIKINKSVSIDGDKYTVNFETTMFSGDKMVILYVEEKTDKEDHCIYYIFLEKDELSDLIDGLISLKTSFDYS